MFIMATEVTENYSPSKNMKKNWRYTPLLTNIYEKSCGNVGPITGLILSSDEDSLIKVPRHSAEISRNKIKGFRKPRDTLKKENKIKKRLITVRIKENGLCDKDNCLEPDGQEDDGVQQNLIKHFCNLRITPKPKSEEESYNIAISQTRKRKSFMSDDTDSRLPPSKRFRLWA